MNKNKKKNGQVRHKFTEFWTVSWRDLSSTKAENVEVGLAHSPFLEFTGLNIAQIEVDRFVQKRDKCFYYISHIFYKINRK